MLPAKRRRPPVSVCRKDEARLNSNWPNIAQAKAEERKAMAVARQNEMEALREEMRAKVVEAEKEIPLAISDALRSGNLGVMDYYRLRNIQADTDMRENLAKEEGKDEEK